MIMNSKVRIRLYLHSLFFIEEEALENFRIRVNDQIFHQLATTAPWHLKYGGFIIAVLVMIIGVVCLSQEEYAVGSVVVLLGFCFSAGGFWYRGSIIFSALYISLVEMLKFSIERIFRFCIYQQVSMFLGQFLRRIFISQKNDIRRL